MVTQLRRAVDSTVKNVPVSPLGWSAATRLVWAATASGLLWLAVAWAVR